VKRFARFARTASWPRSVGKEAAAIMANPLYPDHLSSSGRLDEVAPLFFGLRKTGSGG
jgi:hypothetical protein